MSLTNEELQTKMHQILIKDNLFDIILELKELEKDYKNTDFYKNTKMPITDAAKLLQGFFFIKGDWLVNAIQDAVSDLDVDHLIGIFDKMGEIFEAENANIMETAKEFQKLNLN